MARPIRVEFAGAVYHVTARGNERKRIYPGIAPQSRMRVNLRANQTCNCGETDRFPLSARAFWSAVLLHRFGLDFAEASARHRPNLTNPAPAMQLYFNLANGAFTTAHAPVLARAGVHSSMLGSVGAALLGGG